MAQRRDRLVEPSFLRERHAGQRVDHGQVPAVAGGMQRGGRRGQMCSRTIAGVADLPVAEAELVVGEADRPRIVRALGLLQRLGEERDAARGLAARDGQPAVHAPEVGQPRGIEPLALLGRSSERLGRLPQVVLEQPGFGERTPDLDLIVAPQARAASARGPAGSPPRRPCPCSSACSASA